MTGDDIFALLTQRPDKAGGKRRRALSKHARDTILAKTAGTCHVCGGPAGDNWQADHVVPFVHGGGSDLGNYLPICVTCNRLRWFYTPTVFRMVIQLGICAKNEIKRNTPLGRRLLQIAAHRLAQNTKRRVRNRGGGRVPPNKRMQLAGVPRRKAPLGG